MVEECSSHRSDPRAASSPGGVQRAVSGSLLPSVHPSTEDGRVPQTGADRGMMVMQYAYQFQRLGEYVPTVWGDERQRMYYFRRGLRSEIRREILVGQPQTYEAMYNLAIQLDGEHGERGVKRDRDFGIRTQTPTVAPSTQPGRSLQPLDRGQTFEVGSSAPLSDARSQGRQGRPQRRGPAPTSMALSQSMDRPQGSQSVQPASGQQRFPLCQFCGRPHPGECYRQTGACFICGDRGHFMKDCPRSAPRQGQTSGTLTGPPEDKRRRTQARAHVLTRQQSDQYEDGDDDDDDDDDDIDDEEPGTTFVKSNSTSALFDFGAVYV